MKAVGLGAGGHSKVVIEVLRLMGEYDIIGLLDTNSELWKTSVLGVPVLGDDSLLPELRDQGIGHAFIGVGSVGDTTTRRIIYEMLTGLDFQPVAAVHPRAIISPSAHLGLGPTVLAGVVVNAAAKVGDNVLLNTGSIVEHDCDIGDHVHIATGARLASTVRVGDGAHIGAGATVRQSIDIGEGAVVGAGAVVVKDVSSHQIVAGVPARPLGDKQPGLPRSTQGQA